MDVLLDVRDWVLMVMGQVSGFRGAELSPIKWYDVAVDKYVDTYNNRKMTIFIVFLDNTKTKNNSLGATVTISCPLVKDSFNLIVIVRHYAKLLEKYGFLNDWFFPSLRTCDKNKNIHINTRSIATIFKKRVKQIGEDPTKYAAHSARMGYVKDAVASGIPEELIMKTGRWNTKCWLGYFHDDQYAQVRSSSRMYEFSQRFETSKSKKKHKELLRLMSERQIP